MDQKNDDAQVFLEAYTTGNGLLGDGPTYALVVADAHFRAQLGRLQKLCTKEALNEARISYAPQMWGPEGVEDEMRMECPELVVTQSSFWFVDRGRHSDAQVETRQTSVQHFLEAVANASGPIYLANDPQALEEAVLLDAQTMKMTKAWAKRFAKPAS